jgi:hypothetical protein
MSRNGLGKGLDDLMNGDQVAGKGTVVSASTGTSTPGPALSRGLSTLVAASGGKVEAAQSAQKRRQLLPAWFFFAADILLLAYVVAIAFGAPRPFDLGTILFCSIGTGLGCGLAVFGVVRE